MKLEYGVFGAAVKKARRAKGLTQEKLAELIDITPMHVKQLESERRNPSVAVLFKLVTVLDLSLDSLFSNTDDDVQDIKGKSVSASTVATSMSCRLLTPLSRPC